MMLKPLGDRIVVKQARKKKSPRRIVLPDTAKRRPREGEVVAVDQARRWRVESALPGSESGRRGGLL